jgi:tetratricopeptide (TPR) repeat protein
VSNSIVLYNKALENFRLKSEDIAIIELRKAISLNPDFYEAINLLGVFYIYTKEYKKAEETLKKVISAERNSIRAMEYLKVINPDYSPLIEKQGKAKSNKKKGNIVKKEKETRKKAESFSKPLKGSFGVEKSDGQDIIKIAVGFILGALLMLLIIKVGFSDKAVDTSNDVGEVQDDVYAIKEKYEVKLRDQNDKYRDIVSKLEEANDKVSYYINIPKLLEIENLILQKDYQVAADKLISLKNVEFKGIEKEKYDKLLDDTMTNASWNVFSQGRSMLEAKKYQEALDNFNKAALYSEDDWQYASINLYYMGYCYKELNNYTMAMQIFDEVIEKYPASVYAGYSKSRKNEMEQQN